MSFIASLSNNVRAHKGLLFNSKKCLISGTRGFSLLSQATRASNKHLRDSRMASSFLSRSLYQMRQYSEDSSGKKKEPAGEEHKERTKGTSKEHQRSTISFQLPKSGPLSPIGIALFGMAAMSVYFYYTIQKQKIELDKAQSTQVNTSAGKAKIGGPFELIDQDNNVVTDKTFRGKHTLIYFGFCHCPDICPDELDKMGEALDMLDASPDTKDRITPIFITCDPSRDSPEVIKSYLAEFNSKFIGLTGTIDQVRQACKAYRVYFSKPPQVKEGQNYLVDHSIFSYLMDPEGEFIEVYGQNRTAEEMAMSMRAILTN